MDIRASRDLQGAVHQGIRNKQWNDKFRLERAGRSGLCCRPGGGLQRDYRKNPGVDRRSRGLSFYRRVFKGPWCLQGCRQQTHWVAAGGNKRSASDIRSEHRIIAVTNWLIGHPDAGYDKCAEALEDIGTTSNSIAIIAAGVKRVARWRSANPDGTPEDCSRELGMTLRRVVNCWPSATLWQGNGYR